MLYNALLMRHILLFIFAAVLAACHDGSESRNDGITQSVGTDSLPSLVIQIQQCSRIYTTEYHIHKIITHDDVLRLRGNIMGRNVNIPLSIGDRKIAIPMDATLKAYVDMSQFSERNVERRDSIIIITLPDPQVELTSTRIDQQNIREYVGIVRSHFSDAEMSNYEQQGRQAIIESIPEMNIVATAQQHAAQVLIPLIHQTGFAEENIIIQFRTDLTPVDLIKRLITEKNNG
mgnify:CR=1 FL=1